MIAHVLSETDKRESPGAPYVVEGLRVEDQHGCCD